MPGARRYRRAREARELIRLTSDLDRPSGGGVVWEAMSEPGGGEERARGGEGLSPYWHVWHVCQDMI